MNLLEDGESSGKLRCMMLPLGMPAEQDVIWAAEDVVREKRESARVGICRPRNAHDNVRGIVFSAGW